MARVLTYLSIFFLISTLAYNNCSGNRFEAINAFGLDSASSQCRQKMMAAAKVPASIESSICDEGANYHCDVRSFRPSNTLGQNTDHQCIQTPENGETCVVVNTYSYNTAAQLDQSTPEDLDGSPYDREEVSCINTKIKTKDIAVIQAEGSSLKEALIAAISLCRQRSQL